jgi:hypothetical protein
VRRLIVTENVTVDGRIEMLDDWFDPAADSSDVQEEMQRQGSESDAMLVGRCRSTSSRPP